MSFIVHPPADVARRWMKIGERRISMIATWANLRCDIAVALNELGPIKRWIAKWEGRRLVRKGMLPTAIADAFE